MHKARHFSQVAAVYETKVFENYFVAHIEYLEGETLNSTIAELCGKNLHELIQTEKVNKTKYPEVDNQLHRILVLATQYLSAFWQISEEILHGDPHGNNVVVRFGNIEQRGISSLGIFDFGTSHFARNGFSVQRHWDIVQATLEAMLKVFPHHQSAISNYNAYVGQYRGTKMIASVYKDIINDIGYVDLNDPQFWTRVCALSMDGPAK